MDNQSRTSPVQYEIPITNSFVRLHIKSNQPVLTLLKWALHDRIRQQVKKKTKPAYCEMQT